MMSPQHLDNSVSGLAMLEKALIESPSSELREWVSLNPNLIFMGNHAMWIDAALRRKDDEALTLLSQTRLFEKSVMNWLVKDSSIMQIKQVKRILRVWPAVLNSDDPEAPLFHYGVHNHLAMVDVFLKAGANPYRIDGEGYNVGQSLFFSLTEMCEEIPTSGMEFKLLNFILQIHEKYPDLIHPYRIEKHARVFFPESEWDLEDPQFMWSLKWAIEHLGWKTETPISPSLTWRQSWEEKGSPEKQKIMVELVKHELNLHLPSAQHISLKNRL